MRLLLDTHALFWWQNGNPRLPDTIRETIASSPALFSPVSLYELALKRGRGKLDIPAAMFRAFADDLRKSGFLELPLVAEHATRAGLLEFSHRDPFDRMLIAQALAEDVTLVSNERLFDAAGVKRLWV